MDINRNIDRNGIPEGLSGCDKLSSDEIQTLKFNELLEIFFEDIQQKDDSRIQKLFESGNISNGQIVEMVDRPRGIFSDCSGILYSDIATFLSEKILSDRKLNKEFISLYKQKYQKGYKAAQRIIKNRKLSDEMQHMDDTEEAFCDYILLDTHDVLNELLEDRTISAMMKDDAKEAAKLRISDYEHNIQRYQEISFSDTGESIFLSKCFERFLSKRKKELAELIGTDEKGVSKAIVEGMDFSTFGNERNLIFSKAKATGFFMVIMNNGGDGLLKELSGKSPDAACHYEPNVDKIIRIYYMIEVNLMFYRCMAGTGKFTKLDLSRGWVPNPERDLQNICHMCCMDAIYKMFSEMTKKYYEAFLQAKTGSWDNQRKYIQMESELHAAIEDKEKQIASLERQLASFREKDTNRDKASREYERKLEELERENKQKDQEIADLKDYIQSQEEWLIIQSQTEPEEAPAVDLDNLRAKKFLFVGNVNEALPELKRNFPSSIFMQSATRSIKNISVDAIVFLTKWMSHSMLYKVKGSAVYKKVPSVICSTTNINRVYYDMGSQLDFN